MAVHPWERERRARIEAAFDFLVTDSGCRKRGRFIRSGGTEVFYWNATTGVRAYVESREEFTVQLCPMPHAPFPPRVDDYRANQKIEWFDAWDVERLVTGHQLWKRFSAEQRYGTDPAVVAAYAEALRGPCRPLLGGDPELWGRLRRQRETRMAFNRRRFAERDGDPW
jgi:hypothetical protein